MAVKKVFPRAEQKADSKAASMAAKRAV